MNTPPQRSTQRRIRPAFYALPLLVAQLLLCFDNAEAGGAIARATAATAPDLAALFAAGMLLAVSTFVSEDLACISAGVLAAQGRIDLTTAVIGCFAGIFVGDVLTMLAGRWLGRAALGRAPLRWWIKPADVDRSARWFARRETAAIFISRFIPGSRVATYFAAGLFSKRPMWIVLCLAAAAAIWTPLLVGGSMLLGDALATRLFTGGLLWHIPLAAAGIYLLLRLIRALASHRGRRLLVGAWKRWTQWEFWPMALFYPPVIAHILRLALRHRGFTFTAANPAIPGSGIVGESKIDILRRLDDVDGFVARAECIPLAAAPGERVRQARSFMAQLGLSYPIVLKPDIGERGSGVSIARDEAQLVAHLSAADEDTIIQEYAPGHEFGVFYMRHPDAPAGRIFRITDKRMPELTGDGARTLARLILDDPRAVAMAQFYIDTQGEAAERVPAAGERVRLVELGTHSRGAIFLDGTTLATPQLEAAIDRVSKRFAGFHFGRYDIRTTDVDAFRLGINFKVIELNGVTSEATSIYDPKHSLLDAYRTLFEQWQIAFEIGAANLRRGARPLPARALIRLIRTRRLDTHKS